MLFLLALLAVPASAQTRVVPVEAGNLGAAPVVGGFHASVPSLGFDLSAPTLTPSLTPSVIAPSGFSNVVPAASKQDDPNFDGSEEKPKKDVVVPDAVVAGRPDLQAYFAAKPMVANAVGGGALAATSPGGFALAAAQGVTLAAVFGLIAGAMGGLLASMMVAGLVDMLGGLKSERSFDSMLWGGGIVGGLGGAIGAYFGPAAFNGVMLSLGGILYLALMIIVILNLVRRFRGGKR